MSLDQNELTQHCDSILRSRRIQHKIVILCEGEIPFLESRPSPQAYGRMEQMPDANFYNACVPRWWREYRPQFFNCGDRKDVIDTYFTLLGRHQQSPQTSFLAPEKLFALVDLDIPIQYIAQIYRFHDTEEIFLDLYQNAKVNEVHAKQHRIWVTGVIHKEAYCMFPPLQHLFDSYPISPQFNNRSIRLTDVYLAMSNDIEGDIDLQKFFERVCHRIRHCNSLDFQDVSKLKNSWQHQFHQVADDSQRQALIYALLTVKKTKTYWNQITPAPVSGWSRPAHVFREQLMLEIGRFYSNQDNTSAYHIPVFFRMLSQMCNLA